MAMILLVNRCPKPFQNLSSSFHFTLHITNDDSKNLLKWVFRFSYQSLTLSFKKKHTCSFIINIFCAHIESNSKMITVSRKCFYIILEHGNEGDNKKSKKSGKSHNNNNKEIRIHTDIHNLQQLDLNRWYDFGIHIIAKISVVLVIFTFEIIM